MKVFTLEHRRKLSESHKGKKLSIEQKKKIGESSRLIWKNEDYRIKMRKSRLGHIISKETKKKISNSHLGKKTGIVPVSAFKKGFIPWNKGKKHSQESIERMRLSLKGRVPWNKDKKGSQVAWNKGKRFPQIIGEKHFNWNGGSSFEPYTVDWTQTLKRSIRERDNYTCRICGIKQGDMTFPIHHIDYDKKNCDPRNLILLCSSCHGKTNHNREYWKNFFIKFNLKG